MLPASLEERRTYVHTKTVIVDDVWATIGSANANVRSYTNDTEINCCFIDGRTDSNGLRVSVRDYRRALWAEHLGMRMADVPEQPANDPAVVKLWEDRVATVASVPESGTSPDPVGSRLYDWPVADVHVDRSLPPTIAWLRTVFDGPPVPVPWRGPGSPRSRCTGGWWRSTGSCRGRPTTRRSCRRGSAPPSSRSMAPTAPRTPPTTWSSTPSSSRSTWPPSDTKPPYRAEHPALPRSTTW